MDSIFADKVQGMADVLHVAGYLLVLANSGYSLGSKSELVATLLSQRPSGLALTGVTSFRAHAPNALEREPAGRRDLAMDNLPLGMSVGFSNHGACDAVVSHLHNCGSRRMPFVLRAGAEKRQSCRAAMKVS